MNVDEYKAADNRLKELHGGNRNVTNDTLRVFKALQKKIFRELNVAEVCVVKSIDARNSKNANCVMLKTNQVLTAYIPVNLDGAVAAGQLVVLLFTDTDFEKSVSAFKQNKPVPENPKETRHKKENAIIVAILDNGRN